MSRFEIVKLGALVGLLVGLTVFMARDAHRMQQEASQELTGGLMDIHDSPDDPTTYWESETDLDGNTIYCLVHLGDKKQYCIIVPFNGVSI